MNTYDIGDLVEVTAEFRNAAGDLANPTAVVCKYKKPSGTIVTVAGGSIVNPSTGIYTFSINLASELSGTWHYRAEGTGAVQAAEEGRFAVADSQFD